MPRFVGKAMTTGKVSCNKYIMGHIPVICREMWSNHRNSDFRGQCNKKNKQKNPADTDIPDAG